MVRVVKKCDRCELWDLLTKNRSAVSSPSVGTYRSQGPSWLAASASAGARLSARGGSKLGLLSSVPCPALPTEVLERPSGIRPGWRETDTPDSPCY